MMELELVIVLFIIVYYADSILGYVVWNVGWFINDELERSDQGTVPAIA